MTCREKLQIEHPECIDERQFGGCVGCPDNYGYLPSPNRPCQQLGDFTCGACWDREIPEDDAKSHDGKDEKTLACREYTIDILGTTYTVRIVPKTEDEYLDRMDAYCDKTSKRIVVRAKDENNELDDYSIYENTMLRHEIIHAFLFESGLHNNFKHDEWGHDETMIDWVAVQFPKILEIFKEVGCL